MGGSASKPARKLGKEATSTAQSLRGGSGPSRPQGVARGVAPSGPTPAATPPPQRPETHGDRYAPQGTTGMRGAEASETKTQAIRNDARDPQLLANLQKIGQVQVPRGKMQFQPSNEMLNILSARQIDTEREDKAHEEAQRMSGGVQRTGQVPNRLTASAIISLLDARKQCTTRQQVEDLAIGYDVDVKILDTLAEYVNSPSIAAGARLEQSQQKNRRVEDGDDAPPRIDAVWTDPVIDNDVRRIESRS